MKKLLRGISDYRKRVRPLTRETFARLALGQSPDALLVTCSDSRVAPNIFSSTEPGDLFVVRNVGNLIPPCCGPSRPGHDASEAAALEFAVRVLKVSNIIICGHSECGAMQALLSGRSDLPELRSWLTHGQMSLETFHKDGPLNPNLSLHNQLSQVNVLKQVEHLLSHPSVEDAVKNGKLRIHPWWFDIANADLHAFVKSSGQFELMDEALIENLIAEIGA